MGLAHSPKIVTNQLACFYDMANTAKSWKGKPMTNQVVAGGRNPFTVLNNVQNNNATFAYGVVDLPKEVAGVAPVGTKGDSVVPTTGTGLWMAWTVTPGTANTQYAVTIFLKKYGSTSVTWSWGGVHAGNSNTFSINLDTGVITPQNVVAGEYSYCTDAGDGWWKVTGTTTMNATGGNLYPQINSSNGFYFGGIQIESGASMPSRFANTARPSNQVFYNMVDSNPLTVDLLVYDSVGNFSYNGAHRVWGTLTGSKSLSAYTRIVWINPTQTSSDMKHVVSNLVGNNGDMSVGIEAGYPAFHQYTKSQAGGDLDYTVRGATPITLNTPMMIAATVDRTTATNNINVYLNGKLDATASKDLSAAISLNDTIQIGGPVTDGYAGARMFHGTCYAVMQYNRVLSSAEIMQNFNAMRGRYGL